jgi:acyl-coenzyme A synthetase/AMP-(fatty) acid ligase
MAEAVSASPAALEHRHRQAEPAATVLTLYTSGTPGLPRA